MRHGCPRAVAGWRQQAPGARRGHQPDPASSHRPGAGVRV